MRLIDADLLDYELMNLFITITGNPKQHTVVNECKSSFRRMIEEQPTVEPVRGEWIYWKEQCEYCMNRNTCLYPENQESMEALKQWEKENKFWGSLKLICDYYVLDKDKYYLDNPPECNAEG